MIRSEKFRAEKIQYKDGIGCCIWMPFEDDETMGVCYDFSYEDIDEMISILQRLKDIEADIYEDKINLDKMTKSELIWLVKDLEKQIRLLQDEYKALKIAYNLSNRVREMKDTPDWGHIET